MRSAFLLGARRRDVKSPPVTARLVGKAGQKPLPAMTVWESGHRARAAIAAFLLSAHVVAFFIQAVPVMPLWLVITVFAIPAYAVSLVLWFRATYRLAPYGLVFRRGLPGIEMNSTVPWEAIDSIKLHAIEVGRRRQKVWHLKMYWRNGKPPKLLATTRQVSRLLPVVVAWQQSAIVPVSIDPKAFTSP